MIGFVKHLWVGDNGSIVPPLFQNQLVEILSSFGYGSLRWFGLRKGIDLGKWNSVVEVASRQKTQELILESTEPFPATVKEIKYFADPIGDPPSEGDSNFTHHEDILNRILIQPWFRDKTKYCFRLRVGRGIAAKFDTKEELAVYVWEAYGDRWDLELVTVESGKERCPNKPNPNPFEPTRYTHSLKPNEIVP